MMYALKVETAREVSARDYSEANATGRNILQGIIVDSRLEESMDYRNLVEAGLIDLVPVELVSAIFMTPERGLPEELHGCKRTIDYLKLSKSDDVTFGIASVDEVLKIYSYEQALRSIEQDMRTSIANLLPFIMDRELRDKDPEGYAEAFEKQRELQELMDDLDDEDVAKLQERLVSMRTLKNFAEHVHRISEGTVSGEKSYDLWLYLMRVGDAFKIGISKNPRNRKLNLQSGNHRKVELLAAWEGDSDVIRELESELHVQYESVHVRGEFFALTEDDIQELIARLGVPKMGLLCGDEEMQ